MGLYGVDFYGTDYYGPNPQFLPSTYSVYPFTYEALITHPIGSSSALILRWTKPQLLYPPVPQGTPQATPQGTPQATPQATPRLKDSPTARVRLLRNSLNLPLDEYDGVQLFDLPLSYSPTQWQDNNIPQGFVYYTVFVYDGTQWQRGGDLVALMPGEYNYAPRLWELTPQVFKTWDDYLADPTNTTNPIAQMGPLQRFYNLIGAQFDFIRSEIDSLLTVNDPLKCSGGLLPLLSQELGLDFEPQMGMVQSRKMADIAVHVYKEKGTREGLTGIIGAAVGYGSQVATGYNLMLDQNDAAHTQTTGHWAVTTATGTASLTTATAPVASPSANPTRVQGVYSGTTPSTTPTAVFPSNNTKGNLLVAVVSCWNSPSVMSVTDTAGNTWTRWPAASNDDNTSGEYVEIWYVLSAKGGANSVQAHISTGTLYVTEIAAAAPNLAWSIDKAGTAPKTTPSTSNAVATNGNPYQYDYAISANIYWNTGTVTPPSGWTIRESDTTSFIYVADQLAVVSGPLTATWNYSVASSTQDGVIATFEQGSTGPGNPPVAGGLGSMMCITLNAAQTGGSTTLTLQNTAWSTYGDLTGQAIPLRKGLSPIASVTISRYFYPSSNHNFTVTAKFYDQSGNFLSQASSISVACLANVWTRPYGYFQVPSNAAYLIYQWTSTDSFSLGERVFTSDGQVEYVSSYSSNLALNGDFEGGSTIPWWVGTGSATISTTTSQANTGTHSLQIASTAANTSGMQVFYGNHNTGGTTGIPVFGNALVFVSASLLTGGTSRQCIVGVDFYNSSGAFVSTQYNTVNQSLDTTTGWVSTSYNGTAPSTAAYAFPWVWVQGNVSNGEVHYLDTFVFQVIGAPQPWQNARDQRITLLPQRTNLVTNPSFEVNTNYWHATQNCAISRSATPGSTNRWPIPRNKGIQPFPSSQAYPVKMPIVENRDLLLVNVTTQGNTNITPPYGWKTALSSKTGSTSSDIQKGVYYKIANNEPATYTWSGSNSSPATVEILSYYNVDPNAPVIAQGPGYAFGTGSTVNVGSENVPSTLAAGQQVVFVSTAPNTTIFPLGGLKQETTVSVPGSFSSSSNDQQFTGGTTIPATNGSLSQSALWMEQTVLVKASLLPSSAPTAFPQIGQYALQVLSGSAGLMTVTSDPFPVTAGIYYAGSGYVSGQSLSQPTQMFISWYDANGAPISTVSSLIVQETTLGSEWIRLGVTGVAPAGAVAATLTFQWNTTFTAGESHYLDAVLFEEAPSVRSYFDGSTPLNQAPFAPPISADYLWIGTTGLSPSTYYPKRTQKNYRLTQLLPSYLPAGSTFTLLYAQPLPNVNVFPGYSGAQVGTLPESLPFTFP